MTEAQKTLYYIAENMKMQKTISEDGYEHFQQAIQALEQEPLTDIEQRIFLSAMRREKEVCERTDNETDSSIPPVNLVSVCRSIERKVKKVLWT